MNQQQQAPDPNLIPLVLWLSFIMSVGVFAFVTNTLVMENGDAQPFTLDSSTLPFFAVAGMAGLASLVLPKLFQRANSGPDFDQLSKQEKAAKSFVPMVLGLALSEAVGIFGVIAGTQSNSFETAIPFFAVSFVLLMINKPKKI